MDGKNPKRSQRFNAKRKAIMDAAWKIFSEQGYERTSLDAVVALCGGSKSTIYSYFGSKEELLSEILFSRISESAANVYVEFNDEIPFADQLRRFGRRYLAFLLNSDLLEIYRLAAAEGSNLKFGCQVYERGFKAEWIRIGKDLRKKIPADRLMADGECGEWIAAMQLKALIDSEMILSRLWGAVKEVEPEVIEVMVNRAVEAFLRIYVPELSEARSA